MDARTAIRAARADKGWSQRELARRCGVAQPSISDIESGERDTTVDKLEQILRPAGYRLVAIPTTRPTVAEWAASLRGVGADSSGVVRKSLVQISDDLGRATPTACYVLCATPPAPTGDRRVDAALAALVEHALVERGLETPPWIDEPGRTSDVVWDVVPHPRLRDRARATTPDPFRRRNVYVPAEFFESV